MRRVDYGSLKIGSMIYTPHFVNIERIYVIVNSFV